MLCLEFILVLAFIAFDRRLELEFNLVQDFLIDGFVEVACADQEPVKVDVEMLVYSRICYSGTTYKGQPSDQISTKPPPNHATKHHWRITKPPPSIFVASD